ncbi:CLUMA_CG018080, isoform A [Clunio marinus]|uniref:CLUMA_CG018080, isoform A n=1 Tax=Clunio marinus TaxID=568069 RepID=A0A1J1IXS7_9DIPT|nr:CLUMA_CG018080, isoform A [Clunio marinus]
MILSVVLPAAAAAGIYLIRKQREYAWGWVRNTGSLRGKVFIVTGANTGLGYETTKALAARGATVIMACRNMDKAKEAIEKIRLETKEGELIPLELDLASFDSIRKFANVIKETYPVFDCLINNAGLAVQTKQTTKEGIELHCGTNHIGPFLLTNLLLENIKKNNSRVVVVSSKMHERATIDFENFGKFTEKPSGERSNHLYNNSKLMNFYFAKELFKKGIDVHVCCPGLCNTDFFRDYDPKFYHYILFSPVILFFLRSPEQGSQNIIHCATDNVNSDDMNPDKSYIVVNIQQTKSKINLSDEISEKLWAESAKLCGIN